MTDLVIFVGIVGLVVVVGILVGMIVAGRIDRIIAARPAAPVPEDDRGLGDTSRTAGSDGISGSPAIDAAPQEEERP